MNLLRTSFWSGLATVLKILTGLATTKIMAVIIGPTGIALIGNFTNIINILITFSNGAIGLGVTKYIAEFEDKEEKKSVVSHALKVNLFCSFIIGAAVLIFHNLLSQVAFSDIKYGNVFIVFGLTIVFYGLNTNISAVLNGYKQIRYLIITNMCGSVLSLILAIVITIQFGIFGALINTMIAQICVLFINLLFVRKLKIFSMELFSSDLDYSLLLKLFKYATMSISSALSVPTSTFLIRKYIYNNFSPNEAGYVQGIWSISSAYLVVITTTLSIYYLPTLSSIKDSEGIRREILKGYKFLLPLAIISGTTVYVLRDFIIHILYSPSFLPMREYFAFQIIGDIFKIASWILGYLVVAKAMTKLYIACEIIFSFLFVAFSFLFFKEVGSIGVTYGYALNYFIYLIFMIIVFRRYLFNQRKIVKGL